MEKPIPAPSTLTPTEKFRFLATCIRAGFEHPKVSCNPRAMCLEPKPHGHEFIASIAGLAIVGLLRDPARALFALRKLSPILPPEDLVAKLFDLPPKLFCILKKMHRNGIEPLTIAGIVESWAGDPKAIFEIRDKERK